MKNFLTQSACPSVIGDREKKEIFSFILASPISAPRMNNFSAKTFFGCGS